MKTRGYAGKIPDLSSHCGGRHGRRFVKRQTSKLIRRLEKRLWEDTPKRVTRGWID